MPNITTYPLVTGNAKTGVINAKIELSSADVLSISSSSAGILLVTGESGKTVVPLYAYAQYNYGTVAYSGSIQFDFVLASSSTIGANDMRVLSSASLGTNQSQDAAATIYHSFGNSNNTNIVGLNMYLIGGGSAVTTGDGTIDIYLSYVYV